MKACREMGFLYWYDICNQIGMNITEMREWFDILQDKYNTAGYTDTEKDEFLLDASWSMINGIIGDGDTPSRLEKDKSATEALKPLIETVAITTTSNGLVTDTLVNAAGTKDILMPLSIRLDSTNVAAHFVREGAIGKHENNTYKQGIATAPNYTVGSAGYQLYPSGVYTDLQVTYIGIITTPTEMAEHLHRKVVAKALAKVASATEAEMLAAMDSFTKG